LAVRRGLAREARDPKSLASPRTENEVDAWGRLSIKQKSFVVRVLNWFHFRRPQIGKSWTREEVLTWEMLRALTILPRRVFLGPLLEEIGQRSPSLQILTQHLLAKLGSVEIDEYPSLKLPGALQNRRSDIGLRHPDGTRLWLEAKTFAVSLKDLHKQLADQQKAISLLCDKKASQVIALVPSVDRHLAWPSIRWAEVAKVLQEAQQRLDGTRSVAGDMDGYKLVARELCDRILTHPSRIGD